MRRCSVTTCMALGFVGVALASGCGTEPTPPVSVPIAVTVSPPTVSVVTGGSQDFSATVTNDPAAKGVSWSITGCTGGAAVCGKLINLTTATATYEAPGVAPPGTVGVAATSIADATKSSTAMVGVVAGGPATGRIAFASYRSFCTEVWSMKADGSNAVQLTGLGDTYCSVYADGAAWSPDGSKIAFYYAPNGNPPPGSYVVLDIFVMNRDGSDVHELAGLYGKYGRGPLTLVGRYDPAWSPDSTKLAAAGLFVYCAPGPGGSCGTPLPPFITLMNADGSGLVTRGYGQEPAWSPDGTKIAFTCGIAICVMDADGTGRTNLTSDSSSNSAPAWSPDGTKLAFRSNRTGHYDLYVMNADGSGVTALTGDTATEGRPAWSPDGTKVAFASNRDGNYEIYIMNADGSGVARVTNNPTFDGRPAWTR
jgi:Tol biopolymer transport system component